MTKNEILKTIITHLENKPFTHISDIRSAVKEVLRSRGQFGEVTRQQGNVRITETLTMSDRVALETNEIIYDFLYGRVITPGTDEFNLELPWVHLSNPEKLAEIKNALEQEV
ncbi:MULTISPECIES: hypothetical protein [Bacillus cereus group]|uniref:Uncharacterized protein n=1 Tax=Bacillus cereus 03BB108 TaxID=451709 RepID=A0AAN0SRE9_BACCE|nr:MULTISPECIES: hypothetical protein [Bacillus cereus group]AJI08617.1 hypothetical protein AK40_6160 [Bacillus cereus 03BB108]QKH04573.1 hypothetical protein FOC96_30925 [Bacillus cereus]